MNERKKWKWIFTIVATVIVFLIAIALVLFNKKDSLNDDEDYDETIETPTQTTETYATSFSLNLPETIQILIGTKVNLKQGYVNVTPSFMANKLSYEITQKSNGIIDGIKFENNTIIANSLGNYQIKFKMPRSASTYFSKTIDIIVHENANQHINQTCKTLTVGETKDVGEMFSIAYGKPYSVITDGNIIYSNNKFTAQKVGTGNLIFLFEENFVEFVYEFQITIKDEPEYEIILSRVTNNTLNIDLSDNEFATIAYQIKNRDEQFVSQDVTVTSSDETVVQIVRIANDLTIKIKGIKTGESTITISLKADESIKVDLIVIVN